MKRKRITARLAGFLHKRFRELNLSQVKDSRDKRGRRWNLNAVLKSVLTGLLSGLNGLTELEHLTDSLSPLSRILLGLKKRLPDTTARDILVKLNPNDLRLTIQANIKAAIRRKALNPVGLPCGIVSMDGKYSSTRIGDDKLAQDYTKENDRNQRHSLGTITSCLISSAAKVCIDAFLVPPVTNEKGIFQKAFDGLLEAYGNGLFEVVTYDAGANSLANADYITSKNKSYVFAIKEDQKNLLAEAKRLLSDISYEQATASSEEYVSGKTVKRRIWLSTEMEGFLGWKHLRRFLRVETLVIDHKTGGITSIGNRYFVSSVPENFFNPNQWLVVIRRHWNVENNCHNVFDKIFREDDRPWIMEPNGMLVMQLLRRLAYNLLVLFKHVTQRSEKNRQMPFKELMRHLYLVFVRFSRGDLQKGTKLAKSLATS